MSILDTVKTGYEFSKGVAKGALDTVASVPRNIKKVGGAYFEAKIMPEFTKSIDSLNNSNRALLDGIKKLDKNDVNYAAKKERLNNAVKSNLALQDTIRASAEKAKADYDAGKINLFNKDMTINTTALDKYTVANNKAQQVGFTTEKIAELIAPATSMAKVDKVLKASKVVNATKLGAGAEKVLGSVLNPATAAKVGNVATKVANVGNAVARTVARAGAEGASTGLASLGQSAYQGRLDTAEGAKGAFKEAGQQALTSGAFKGVLTGTGEVIRGLGLPAKLYSRTYKTTDKEVAKMFENLGDNAGATLPGHEMTLAEWALNKGIAGPTKKQAATVMQLLDDSEKAVINEAKNSGVHIVVDPGAVNTAKSIAEEYADYGKGEVAEKANQFLNNIAEDGTASVEDTIKFKRLLDGLRSKASFRNAKVGDNISYWANELRGQINDIPALGQINKDYAFAMKARDALISKAKSENNKMILGALEAYTAAMPLMNAGVSEGGASNLAGAAIVAAKRIANSPGYQTSVAQGLNKFGDTTVKNYAGRAILGKAVASPETFGMGQNESGFTPDKPADEYLGFTPDTQNAGVVTPEINTSYQPTADDADLGFTALK